MSNTHRLLVYYLQQRNYIWENVWDFYRTGKLDFITKRGLQHKEWEHYKY